MITIYDKLGRPKVEVGINEGSIRRFNLMNEDFVKLKFSLTENMPLLIGDYVDLSELPNFQENDETTKKFVVNRNYYPTYNKNTGGWNYDIQINAYYYMWKNKILMFNPLKGAAESSFSLTDTIEVHAGRIVENLKHGGFKYGEHEFECVIEADARNKGIKLITYSSTTIFSALDLIAQTFECEWWLDGGRFIHFGYRKGEEANKITLTLNEEIADASTSDSDGVHATRIYPFGGTTNVPKHYRDRLVFYPNSAWFEDGKILGVMDSLRPVMSSFFRGTKNRAEAQLLAVNNSTSSGGGKYSEGSYNKSAEKSIAVAGLNAQTYDVSLEGLVLNFTTTHSVGGVESDGLIEVGKAVTIDAKIIATDGIEEVIIAEETNQVKVDKGKLTANISFANSQKKFLFVPTEIIIRVEVVSAKWTYTKHANDANLVNGKWYDFSAYEYEFSNKQANISFRKSAESVETPIIVDGSQYNAIINPDFRDNGSHILITNYQGNLQSIKEYQFPEIIISRVPDVYFSIEEGGVQTGVVQKNLMLPIGTNYVQADNVADSDVVEAVVVYDWIYPKTKLDVTNVVPFNDWKVEVEDGETISITTYDITLPIKQYADDMIVDDALYTIFQSGNAAGLRFELNYISQTDNDVTFRIVPNEDYSVTVPNESTIPTIGDTVILDGIDVSFIDGSVVSNAENELLEQAKKDIKETSKEDKVVDITLSSDYAFTNGRIALGTLISLVDVLSSEDNAYDSRILGFEECLDIPWDKPKYIIGDKNYYNRNASIESKLEAIEKGSITLSGVGGGGGSNVQIIKTNDSTKPNNNNVYSAQRVDEDFLHTKEDDIVNGNIAFEKNISVKGNTTTGSLDVKDDASVQGNQSISGNQTIGGNSTVRGGQSIQGTQEVGKLQTLKGGMQTEMFHNVAGTITGAQLTPDGLFSAAGIISNSFKIHEFIYNVIRSQGGKQVLSNAATVESCEYKIKSEEMLVSEYDGDVSEIEYVLLTIKADENNKGANPFRKGDILYGYVNNIGETGEVSAGGECTMRIIEDINDDAPMVVKAALYSINNEIKPDNIAYYDYVSSNIAPTPSMALAQRGSTTDESRRTSIFLDAESENIIILQDVSTPRIKMENYGTLNGVLPEDLYNDIKTVFTAMKRNDPVMFAKYGVFQNIIQYDHNGQFIQRENNRGEWSADTAQNNPYVNNAQYFDTVTCQGSLYKCLKSDTAQRPGDGDDWLLLVAKGASATDYKLIPSVNSIHIKDGKLIPDNMIDVIVGVTNQDGYEEISDEYGLEHLGLSVWFDIDGNGDTLTKLIVGGERAYEVEEGGAVVIAEEDDADLDNIILVIESESIDLSTIKDYISMYLIQDADNEGQGQIVDKRLIPVTKDGREGKDGSAGASLYPAGELVFGDDYSKLVVVDEETGQVLARPIKYYQPKKDVEGTYYVLQKNISAAENTDDKLSNTEYWRPFTKLQYLFVEFLMANWAKFGSDKGGVFYDKYLFSQTGVNKSGTEGTFTKDMFDEHGNLTNEFIPNLLINFDEGEAMLGKLTEVYHRYPANTGLIRMGDYHNIIVTPDAGRYGGDSLGEGVQGFSSPLIILPQMQKTKWPTNGAHISIFADVGDYYKYPLEGLNDAPVGGVYKQMSAFALISADDILDGVGLRTRGIYSGNWIVANGYRSKFMLLSPGCMIKLRLSYNENTSTSDDDTYNWVVEGGNEVQVTKSQIFARDLHWSSPSEATSKVPYQGYEWDRINNRGATLEFNWQAGDDVNHPYYPVILTVGHVGDNLGATTINKDGVYLGHTKPNILLSTTQNGEGWYGGCYYRLLDAVNDEGYPDTDLE